MNPRAALTLSVGATAGSLALIAIGFALREVSSPIDGPGIELLTGWVVFIGAPLIALGCLLLGAVCLWEQRWFSALAALSFPALVAVKISSPLLLVGATQDAVRYAQFWWEKPS